MRTQFSRCCKTRYNEITYVNAAFISKSADYSVNTAVGIVQRVRGQTQETGAQILLAAFAYP